MAYDRAKEVAIAEGKADGILVYIWNHTTLRHYRLEKEMQLQRKQREASDRDPDHHNRNATTTKTKEQGRQEKEGDNETQPHHRMDPRMASANHTTRRNGRT
jgi:hypothetical protein